MGKQIRFFLNQKDINEFYAFLKDINAFIMYEDGTVLDECDITHLQDCNYIRSKFKYNGFFITYENSAIQYKYYSKIDRKCLSPYSSEVIEFLYCCPKDNKYQIGRVWLPEKYYDDQGNIIEKSKVLSDLYNKIYRYIRKNYRLSVDKFAYIAKNAYADYLTGNFIPCECNTIFKFDE